MEWSDLETQIIYQDQKWKICIKVGFANLGILITLILKNCNNIMNIENFYPLINYFNVRHCYYQHIPNIIVLKTLF